MIETPDKVRTYYLITNINDDGTIHSKHIFKVPSLALSHYRMLAGQSDSAYEQTKDFPKDLQVFYTIKLQLVIELEFGTGKNKRTNTIMQTLADNSRNN